MMDANLKEQKIKNSSQHKDADNFALLPKN